VGVLPFPKPQNLGIEWDAENRLTASNQGTLRSEFSYDGESRRVRIVEKANAVVQSDTHFVWCENDLCEARSGVPLSVTARYYTHGSLTNGSLRFYARDHLESVREVTDGSANVVARLEYDPYGRSSVTVGTSPPFEFNGNYRHSQTNLLLTLYRAYDPDLGRWTFV
jgi:YD repeat-containing protein